MSKLISVKIEDREFRRLERSVKKAGLSRNAYINKAVRLMNRLQERQFLAKELQREADMIGQESMAVLREFEAFQDEGL